MPAEQPRLGQTWTMGRTGIKDVLLRHIVSISMASFRATATFALEAPMSDFLPKPHDLKSFSCFER